MKKLLVLLCALPILGMAQTKSSCCVSPKNNEFATLAMNEKFKDAHAEPVPLQDVTFDGSDVMIESSDEQKVHVYIVKSTTSSSNWLFVYHEWWGLNDHIKKEADALAKEMPDVNIMAIDLFDNQVTADAAAAAQLSSSVKSDRVKTIIQAANNYAGTNAKICTMGWCFGGGWSLQTALTLGDKAAGCVIYYGMPETDKTKLNTLKCDILGIYGTEDQFINKTMVDKFDTDLKSLNKKHEFLRYKAVHAFANPSNPKYDKVSTEDAHGKVVTFLKSHFETK